ncbi:hypothetical protein LSCM1_00087 [Leishmania martiniquensis]|uniref:Uncharacterized protein n=1 Tax=Leishmania martiniquensis TaxID=1580590 RepID=A0A836G250_9TRYP|nr:hypothetical protein LSCM1_00087 [Leishmania martiniquensis]
MPTAGVDADGREVRVHLPPGVYRAAYSATPSEAGTAGPQTFTGAMPPNGPVPTVVDTRRRFHQLRDLRRELSGRPQPSTEAAAAAAAAAAAGEPAVGASSAPPSPQTKEAFLQSSSLTRIPLAVSLGLPLDRLAADDPATPCVLRTAAAERALRLQQAENDELKRVIVTQRQEAARMQCLIDRLSSELSEANQTVLRQTATMKSLAAEMERLDAYHLIKEKRSSQTPPSATATATAPSDASSSPSLLTHQRQTMELALQIEQLTREKAELQRRVSQLTSRQGDKTGKTPIIEAIDKDDDSSGEVTRADSWVPSARTELQRLVQALAAQFRAGASPPASVGPSFAPLYEVELSCLTCFVPLSTPPNAVVAVSAPAKAGSIVCAYGPYNMQEILLRAQCLEEKLGSGMRCRRVDEKVPVEGPTCCVFYAMRDTCGAVRLCLYESVTDAKTKGGRACSGEVPVLAAATATVAVQTLIASALASRRELELMPATLSAHTVHLATEKGTLHGAVTFRVRVTEMHGRRYCDCGGATSRIHSDAEYRRRTSPFSSALRAGSGATRVGERSLTPLGCVDAGRAGGESVAEQSRRGLMLSPSRYDDATPIAEQHFCLTLPLVSLTTPSATRHDPVSHDSLGNLMDVPQQVERETLLLTALSTQVEEAKKTGANAAATRCSSASSKSATSSRDKASRDKNDFTSAVPKATPLESSGDTVLPQSLRAGASSLPPSPVAALPASGAPSHFSPPPPPIAPVPAPPLSLMPTAAPSVPDAVTIRIHIKEVRYTREDCGEDVVEDLLEHRCLRVVVRIDGELVFAAPTRPNESHAVWSAEEGTFTITLTTGQEVRFEIGDDDAARCEGVLLASEILNSSGERDVTLVSVGGGRPCGRVSVALEGPA